MHWVLAGVREGTVTPIFQLLGSMSIGFASGLLTASGGAYKDVQWEPFSWRTFLRSPIVGAGWGGALGAIAPSAPWVLIGLACIGGERLSVEAWKALRRKMPSKFKHEKRDWGWLLHRLGFPED